MHLTGGNCVSSVTPIPSLYNLFSRMSPETSVPRLLTFRYYAHSHLHSPHTHSWERKLDLLVILFSVLLILLNSVPQMIQARETPSFNLSDVWTATEEQFLGSFQGENIGYKSPHIVLYILSELSTETEVITLSERVLSPFFLSFL